MQCCKFFVAALSTAFASVVLPFGSRAADDVAVQYHFSGAANLASDTNFDRIKKILTVPPGQGFKQLVLDRYAGLICGALQFDSSPGSVALVRPLLDDLLNADSVGSFGGRDKDRMDFVLALRLDAKTADIWQKNLETVLRGKGEAFSEEGFSGSRWSQNGNHGFWLCRARDWTLVGRGQDLQAVRTRYLQHIKQDDRPAAKAGDSWLGADVDWPLLSTWAPASAGPFKLPNSTSVEVTIQTGRIRAKASITYPEAVPWTVQPWRVPKGIISSPLSSFTATRDVAAYLKPGGSLTRLSNDPLTNQLYCWALRQMVLESYAAWPVTDATNTLRALGQGAAAILDPILHERGRSSLSWEPNKNTVSWLGFNLTAPTLQPAHDTSGDYLLAEAFPLSEKFVPASDQLWSQFETHTDMVYYDWELTGLRLMQWRLLSEMFPVFAPPTPDVTARQVKAAKSAKPPGHTPLAVTEAWLAELSSPVLGNTVTEITRKSPTELTVVRNSQFLFTGLELVMLSHWLADAPVGPVEMSLLPQAKMSGPGAQLLNHHP